MQEECERMQYTIIFSQQEMQVINDALVEMPYFKAAPVIDSINRQLSASIEAAASDTPKTDGDETEESGSA